jgi:hypothetical protein
LGGKHVVRRWASILDSSASTLIILNDNEERHSIEPVQFNALTITAKPDCSFQVVVDSSEAML